MSSARACALQPDEAWRANVETTMTLAQQCRRRAIKLVYTSTDYVFCSSGLEGVDENEPAAPLQQYGRTKREAEQIVSTIPGSLIVRLPALYGPTGPNGKRSLPVEVAHRAHSAEPMVVDDAIPRYFTFTGDVARVIDQCIDADVTGVVHVSSPEPMTFFAFARTVANSLRIEEALVQPSQDLDEIERPSHVRLRTDRLRRLGLTEPPTFSSVVSSHGWPALGVSQPPIRSA